MTNSFGVNSLSQRGPSRALWGNLFEQLRNDPGRGVLVFDDFANHPAHISDQSIGNYATYIDTGVTLKALDVVDISDGQSGVMEVAGNDAANDEGHIATGGDTGGFCKISDDSGEKGGVFFEARIKKASITTTTGTSLFIGLAEAGLASNGTLTNSTGAMADKDFVGFEVLAAAGATVNAVYKKEGQTKQANLAAAATMVADTWIKLGFRYQPWRPSTQQIAWFVNGAELGTYVTSTNIAAATFPDGEELAMLFATMCHTGSTTEDKLQMDWWAAAQLFVANPF